MITDKDREELIEDLRAYNDAWVLEEGKDRDRLIEFESAIRAESAEQARKEAAERAVAFVDNNIMGFADCDVGLLTDLRAAILGDSAAVSTDSRAIIEKQSMLIKGMSRFIDRIGIYQLDTIDQTDRRFFLDRTKDYS